MEKEKISISSILLIALSTILIVYLTFIFEPTRKEIHHYYQVYLSGEKVGLISSKEELYDLIDKEEQEIKDK